MPLFIAHAVTAQHFAGGGSPLDFHSVPAHSSKELKAHYAALSSVDSQLSNNRMDLTARYALSSVDSQQH
ncbi:hypothetical protein [Gardnerella sp. KA00255]|uniref:hypothetical protein n=1 Tax=Gardnerella sp. KA00255 TaxID=2749073 RepID=UPI003BABE6AC